jgi:hypothetical protein
MPAAPTSPAWARRAVRRERQTILARRSHLTAQLFSYLADAAPHVVAPGCAGLGARRFRGPNIGPVGDGERQGMGVDVWSTSLRTGRAGPSRREFRRRTTNAVGRPSGDRRRRAEAHGRPWHSGAPCSGTAPCGSKFAGRWPPLTVLVGRPASTLRELVQPGRLYERSLTRRCKTMCKPGHSRYRQIVAAGPHR